MKKNNINYFNFDEIKKKNRLGRGSYGEVFEGEFLYTKYALKYYDLDQNANLENLIKEISTTKHLEHPNINRLYGYSYNQKYSQLIAVLKLMPINLDTLIYKQ